MHLNTKYRFLEVDKIQVIALSMSSCQYYIHNLSSYIISPPRVLARRDAQLLRSWEQPEMGTSSWTSKWYKDRRKVSTLQQGLVDPQLILI